MKLPKYQKKTKLGEDGITILKRIVETKLEWIYRTNHQEHDFGIDAYIDIITNQGQVTGKSIAIQVKSGDSYFKEKNKFGWVFRDDLSHLNYYLNFQSPVILVLVNVSLNKAFWCHIDPNKTESTGVNWKITVPFKHRLSSKSKPELLKFVSPVKDYIPQLEHYWNVNKQLMNSGILALVVDKSEVLNSDYQNLDLVFNRMQATPELIEKLENKVDIWIDGYNDDERELYKIEEVKIWILSFMEKISGWSYFLSTSQGLAFLKLMFLCFINVKEISDSGISDIGIEQKKVDFDMKSGQPFFALFFKDLNAFTDKHGISDDENIVICERVMKELTGKEIKI